MMPLAEHAALDAAERAVLRQLSRTRPTEDGDIIGKQTRDRLIERGLAFRAYGHTTLTMAGAQEQYRIGDCEHDWQGWREFRDGSGGEQVCASCGMGALAWTLRSGP